MFDEAMAAQAAFCETNGAAITAQVCRAIGGALDRSSETGRRAIDWGGDPLADALPLRLVAPFHALYRARRVDALIALFEGRDHDGVAAVRAAVAAHDTEVAGWLDGPPQTNGPGRSAAFVAALSVLAGCHRQPFELLEIGSSAGLNLLIDRFGYRLGDVCFGPRDPPVVIAPEWRGRAIDAVEVRPVEVQIASVRGVDLARGDAPDWLEERLHAPQAAGVTRVMMHGAVWPYLPPETQRRIAAAMHSAGACATSDRPLAWIAFEHDSFEHAHRLRLRSWPGGEDRTLATAHPHASWIDWTG